MGTTAAAKRCVASVDKLEKPRRCELHNRTILHRSIALTFACYVRVLSLRNVCSAQLLYHFSCLPATV